MKKVLSLLAFFVLSTSVLAVDLAVPEELIGHDTLGIAHIHLKALKLDQITKTLTDKFGGAPDAQMMAANKVLLDDFIKAGGQGISVIFNSGKGAKKEDAADNSVICITKGEDADKEKLTELFNAFAGPMKDKFHPDCPKDMGNSLVWYSKKFKMPKASEDREAAFTTAYSHLSKDASVSIVFVPDEDAVELAESSLKETDPEEVKKITALLNAEGFVLFSDFGVAAEPALKVMILAEDADGAKTLSAAAEGLISGGKKDAPPPFLPVLNSLKIDQIGANVQVGVNLSDLAKTVKAVMQSFAEQPAAPAKPAEDK